MNRLTILTVGLALSTGAFAQVSPMKKAPVPATPAIPATSSISKPWQVAPIDPAVTALPAQFNGVDTDEVVVWVEKVSAPRGEFEASEAYQAKIAALRRQPITGAIALGDQMAFVYKIPDALIKYDADTQNFAVEIRPVTLRDGGKSVGDAYIVKAKNEESTYVGSNAYGAKTDILKLELWSTQLLPNKPLGTGKISAAFAVPLDQAPAVKANLCIAYFARLNEPQLVKVNTASTPTRDSPRELIFHNTALRADIDHAIIFNRATGHVLARVGE